MEETQMAAWEELRASDDSCSHLFSDRHLSCLNVVKKDELVQALKDCGTYCQSLDIHKEVAPAKAPLAPVDVHEIVRDVAPWVDKISIDSCTMAQNKALQLLTQRPEMECEEKVADETSGTRVYVVFGLVLAGLLLLGIVTFIMWRKGMTRRITGIFQRNGQRAATAMARYSAAGGGGVSILPLYDGGQPRLHSSTPAPLAITQPLSFTDAKQRNKAKSETGKMSDVPKYTKITELEAIMMPVMELARLVAEHRALTSLAHTQREWLMRQRALMDSADFWRWHQDNVEAHLVSLSQAFRRCLHIRDPTIKLGFASHLPVNRIPVHDRLFQAFVSTDWLEGKDVALALIQSLLGDLVLFALEQPNTPVSGNNYLMSIIVAEYIHYWLTQLSV